MYVYAWRVLVDEYSLQSIERIYKQYVIPDLKKQEGFQDILLMTGPSGNAVVAITLWESSTHAQLLEQNGFFIEINRLLKDVVRSTTAPASFEVVLSNESSLHFVGDLLLRNPDAGITHTLRLLQSQVRVDEMENQSKDHTLPRGTYHVVI